MPDHANLVPDETHRLIEAIRQGLADIPEIHRKAAMKHATEAIWHELIDQAEHAKAASRQAGPDTGAKANAAATVIRDMTGAPAETDAARISRLEQEVQQLRETLASKGRVTRASAQARRHREIDPGDAVPEGVAVQEPQPLDKEAETALENLKHHLDPH